VINEILTHVEDAKNRLLEQYKGKPGISSLLGAIVQEWQEIETVCKDLNDNRSVDSAVGVILDRVGAIVGQEREPGQADEDYRILIKSKIGQNISQGEPERIIETFKVLKQASIVLLSELFPAAVGVQGDVTFADQGEVNKIYQILERVAAAGVRIESIDIFDSWEDSFAFEGALPGLGFGDELDPLLGGVWAEHVPYLIDFAFDGDNPNYLGFGDTGDVLVGGALTVA